MRRIGIGTLAVLALGTGCSSGHSSATRSPSSTTSSTLVAARPGPEQAAITLANRMLDDAIVPSGRRRSDQGLPRDFHGPYEWPGAKQVVTAHRVWVVRARLPDVAGYLQANTPAGYEANGGSTLTSPTGKVYAYDQRPRELPPNVSSAVLEVSVAADGPDTVLVRADSTVGWTFPRPAAEFVPATDRVVIVTVVHDFRPGKPRGKRVVATDPKLVQPVVQAFNALRVSAPATVVHGCPPMGPRSVSYHIAFTKSPTAPPDIVAAFNACGAIGVTVAGRAAPTLGDFAHVDFGNAVAHVLGLAEPHLG